jgi:glycosyltransferase involved in cell wall biosynthesis
MYEISVVVITYNRKENLERCINSLESQSYDPKKYEIIIVDDGSEDDTSTIIKKISDPRIKLFRQENHGEAAARNKALEYASGKYISFLDADDLYLPDHLDEAINFFSTHVELDGIYSDGFYVDSNGKRLQTLSSRRRGPFEGYIFEEVVFGSDVFGPPVCVLLRRSLIIENNLRFDENIIIGPDWDFLTKFSEKGKFGYINKATCLYRVHTTNITLRTGVEKRYSELVKCRINAIKLNGFSSCSNRIKLNVFYDLLVHLLSGKPKQQSEIIDWPEFKCQTKFVQAKLLRLMATRQLLLEDSNYINYWLKKALKIYPLDLYSVLTLILYNLNQKLLRKILLLRVTKKGDIADSIPFAELNTENK